MPRLLFRILGGAFLVAGLAGFLSPTLLGMHLTPVHNVIHILSGALALCVGFLGSRDATRSFTLAFGSVYVLLGILGFVLPSVVATLLGHSGSVNARALAPDNVVHLLIGGLFLLAAFVDLPTHVEPRPHPR